MLVYETDQFTRQADHLGVLEKVADLRLRVTAASSLAEVRQFFDALVPYYKDRSGKVRIVARMRKVAGHDVFCLLGAFERKSDEYDDFLGNRRGYGAKHLDSTLDDSELDAWVHAEIAAGAESVPAAEPLPDSFWGWLDPPTELISGLRIDDDLHVYESKRWVDDMQKSKFQDYWSRFFDLVHEVASNTTEVEANSASDLARGRQGEAILFRRFASPQPSLLLIAPFLGPPDDAAVGRALTESQLSDESTDLNVEAVARRSRRTYPSYLLADQEAWHSIEKEDAANLALSGEEESLLESAAGVGAGQGIPLFINGRAGSGKSTMLAYLFAAFCVRRFKHNLPGRPLYLTYNERLLDVARRGVQSLLRASHELVGSGGTIGDEVVSEWFAPFREYLLGRLPEETRQRFAPERHISFHHFRNAYLGRPGRIQPLQLAERKRWSPELSWYVIRTFIKGYASAGYLDPDLFSELPRAERVVSQETFSEIYGSIWERWYHGAVNDSSAWDDQDLVLAVLQDGSLADGEPIAAVVCDEAQDFTRRELQLLLRALALTDYDLSGTKLNALPLVLAGDPLQTLNPTGFRWESIQAALHEELAIKLGMDITVRLEQLENNYRSTAAIVGVVNGIQLWRSVLFEIAELAPQSSWDVAEGSTPHKYILGRNISDEEVAQLVEDTIIVVPCDEGGEVDYVRDDPVLSRMFPDLSGDAPPRNILSATTAKGSEFGRVIVWCFGEACPEGLFHAHALDEQATFEAEYFLNKLYVAASRAKQHLFVVDTDRGDARLWSQGEPTVLDAFVQRSADPGRWQAVCRSVELAPIGASSELQETAIEDTAIVLRDQGKSARDPRLLRQAAGFFRRVPNDVQAQFCEAWALRFEEMLVEAGRLFDRIGDHREAYECFWEARSWMDLRDWYRATGDAAGGAYRDQRPLVEFMTGQRDADAVKAFTSQLATQLDTGRVGSFIEPGWRAGIAAFVSRADELLASLRPEDALPFARVLMDLADRRFDGAAKTAGNAFFYSGDLDRAVSSWEKAGFVRHFDYRLAKARTGGLPQGLEYLAGDDDDQGAAETIRLWAEAGSPDDPGWTRWVARAQEKRGDKQSAFAAYLDLGEGTRALNVYPSLVKDAVGYARRSVERLGLMLSEQGDVVGLLQLLRAARKFEKECVRAASAGVEHLVRAAERSGWREPLGKDEETALLEVLRILTDDGSWSRLIDPAFVGAAHELAGHYVATLRFYERFVDSREPRLRDSARRRWLRVKQLQMDQTGLRGRTKDREKTRRERAAKAHDWGFGENDALDEHPTLPEPALVRSPDVSATAPKPTVVLGVEIDIRGDQVTVLDLATNQFIRIDLSNRSASSPDGEIHADGDLLSLPLPSGANVRVDLANRSLRVDRNNENAEVAL